MVPIRAVDPRATVDVDQGVTRVAWRRDPELGLALARSFDAQRRAAVAWETTAPSPAHRIAAMARCSCARGHADDAVHLRQRPLPDAVATRRVIAEAETPASRRLLVAEHTELLLGQDPELGFIAGGSRSGRNSSGNEIGGV
jgi:hypothetical protein